MSNLGIKLILNRQHFLRMPRQPTKQGFRRIALGLLCCALTVDSQASAAATPADGEISRVALHGFGTLGAARSDDANAEYIRDLSQPAGAGKSWTTKVDSLLGIQANIEIGPQTEGVLQAVTRYHSDGSYDPELTWAFLRHEFQPDFSLRVGRLGTEFYMLGDSRLVGYSNISVRPPPDFYGTLIFSYIDGIDISSAHPLANGLLSGKFFVGASPEKVPFSPGLTWDLNGSILVGGYIDYLSGPWRWRVSHARSRFENKLPTDQLVGFPYLSLVPEMSMANQWARFNSIGLVYEDGPINLQIMLNNIQQESPAYEDSEAGYVLAAYRFGRVTPYFAYSRSRTSNEALPLKNDPILDLVTTSLVAQSHVDQHTFTLGSRWDLTKNLALKTQVDLIHGDPSSTFLFKFKSLNKNWSEDMAVYSLALDFVF